MLIRHENIDAIVLQADDYEIEWLRDTLSAEVSSYENKYRRDDEGRTHVTLEKDVSVVSLLSTAGGVYHFPSGLVPIIERRAHGACIGVEVENARTHPLVRHQPLPDWLRDYQRDAVEAVQRRRCGVIKAATGAGKTEIFVALTQVIPVEWLFLVHKIDLLPEVAERYRKWTGESVGTFTDGVWKRGTCNVTVAGFAALHAALRRGAPGATELLQATQAINVDECHAVSAETHYAIVRATPNAYWRVGQSGTPSHRHPLDQLKMVGVLGPVIYKIDAQTLIAKGVISRASINLVLNSAGAKGNTWSTVYRKGIVKNDERNALLAKAIKRCDKPAMAFVEHIHQGDALARLARAEGLRVEFVHGKTVIQGRRLAVRRLNDGELDVIIATDVFKEGVNAPNIRSVVNCGAKETPVATLQRLGRGIRMDSARTGTFTVWDTIDTGHAWLHKHSLARKETYEGEGYEVTVLHPHEL